jgi:hypothetical protein
VTFYATDDAFSPIAEVIRQSGKTYDVFRVAKTFLAHPERFVFVLRKNPESDIQFHRTIFDSVPFLRREDALDYLLRKHLDRLCDRSEEECEAPKGSFSQVARCPLTKVLIGVPNHHSYKDLLHEHFLQHVHDMPFDRFCEGIEFSREADDIAAWLERMKKRTIYRLKELEETTDECSGLSDELEDALVKAFAASAAGEVAAEAGQEAGEADPSAEVTIPEQSAPGTAEGKNGAEPALNSLRELRIYLKENADRFLRSADSMRVCGTELNSISDGDIRRFVDYCWNQQKRFPLDTANAMRGKFKQHRLHVYKRGKRGPSYVAPVARKFREAKTVFSPELEKVLALIEQHPLINLLELGAKMDGESVDREGMLKALAWLLREGYVTEFEDGTLLTYGRQAADREEGGQSAKRRGRKDAARENGGPRNASEDLSVAAHLEHLSQREEHGSCDESDGAGEDEDYGGLQDGGDALDGRAQLLLQHICGVGGHGGEGSASFADGDEAANGGRDAAASGEEFAEGDALAGADGNGLEVFAQCAVGHGPAGEAEGIAKGDAVGQNGAQGPEEVE